MDLQRTQITAKSLAVEPISNFYESKCLSKARRLLYAQ